MIVTRATSCASILAIAATFAVSDHPHAADQGFKMSDPRPEQAQVPYNPSEGGETGEIEGVLRRHQAALLAMQGVTGVAIGRSQIGDPAIVVYLLDKGYRRSLPATVEGHPVVVEITGPINALKK